MTYDPTWIRKSPILIPQAVHNEALIGQKGSVRLDALDWGQKVGATTLDLDQQASTALALTPLNNNKMFIVWGAGTDGRYALVNANGVMDSTAYQVFESGGFLDYGNGLATILLPNGNVVVAYGQDQGANNAIVFKIFSENGDVVRDAVTVKTHATETQWGIGLAALPDGQFVVTWEENAAGAHSYFAIYDADGDVVKGYTSLGGQKGFPQPAPLSDGNWIVTYEATGLRYQTYDRQGIQIVGETLFRSGVSQAAGVRTMANGQIVIPFVRGFGIIDRQGNVVVAPEVKEVAGTYSVTVLPHDNIVAQNNNGTSGYYKIYDSEGNLLNTQVTYTTEATPIAAGDVATFKNGNFMLAYVTDATSKLLKFFIHEGTKAGFAGDLTVSGAFGLSAGTTVNEISTDGTLVGDSDDVLVTEKAAKTYVDAQIGGLTPNKIEQGNSRVIVLDDAAEATSVINVVIDDATIADFTNAGLDLGGSTRVSQIRNDIYMGGWDGANGSQTALTTEYAAREYIDNIHDSMSEPTGFQFGNSNTATTIGIDSSNSVFIEPYSGGSGSYDIFFSGQRWRKTTKESVVISDVEGIHYVYFDTDGVLKETTTFNLAILYSKVYVAVVYWDATNKEIIYFGDERHGMTMDGKTHVNIHLYRGTLYNSGLALADITADGTGALNIEAQFSTSNGSITDEDISHTIPSFSFPANVDMWYLSGSADWRLETADNFAVVNTGTGRVGWNKNTAGTWSLAEATDGYFVLTHIYVTNDLNDERKMVGIVGQAEYATLQAARTGAADEINALSHGELPFAEFHPVATLIFETQDAFTNTPKAVIRTNDEGDDWTDWRTSGLSPGSGSVSDHGSLSGLANDDHLQYFRVDGLRAVTGNLSVNGTSTLTGSVLIGASITQTAGVLTLPFGTDINEFSTDGTLVGDSDNAVPTEQAVKTYVDTAISNLNPDKIWENDSSVEVIDDGTNAGIVEVTTDGVVRGTWASNGLTLQNGTNINEFSIDGTLGGDSDNALPTEKAVKTYVDAQIEQQSHKIFQGDSYIQVIDADSTAQAYAEVVINGTQVAYWDDAASSQRFGKAPVDGGSSIVTSDASIIGQDSSANELFSLTTDIQIMGLATDTFLRTSQISNTISGLANAVDVLSLTDTTQRVGVSGDTNLSVAQSTDSFSFTAGGSDIGVFNNISQRLGITGDTYLLMSQTGNTMDMYVGGTQVIDLADTSQTFGVSGDSRIELNQTANTLDLYAGTVQILAGTQTSQIFGVAGDTRLTLNQGTDTFALTAGATTIINGGLLTLTLGVGGDTTIALNQTDDQVAITAGGQSQILVETSGTTIYDDLTVTGDLFVDGTTFVVNQTEVKTADNMITVNYGEPGAGVTRGYAGIQVDRGTLNDYYFIFAENTDTFRIGESADGTSFVDLQAVATREDSPTSMVVPWWNATDNRFDTAGSSSIAVNTTTDVITMTAASSAVATFESDGLTLANGTNIDEFSIDGTLAGDSDNAVPTEKAVKTYVDAQIGGVSNTIFQGDSHVTVYDDGTSQAYAEVVINGTQVQYWDDAASSIRLGKASGAGRVTVNDTEVQAHIGATSLLDITSNVQRLGSLTDTYVQVQQDTNLFTVVAGASSVMSVSNTTQRLGTTGSNVEVDGSGNAVTMDANSTEVFNVAETSQIFGVAGDTNIDLDQSTDTALINVGGTEVFNATPDVQTVGGVDSYITIDQTSGATVIGANSVEAMTLDQNGLQLFTTGATINEFSTDGTLAGNSDTAVPTEKAVKTYVDAQVLAGSYIISQDDSWVKVTDDGTNAGWIEIVADGVQVAYFDPNSATQRIGKAAESRMLVADDTVSFHAGASPALQMTLGANGMQLASGETVNSISLSTSLGTSDSTLVTQGAVKSYTDTGDSNTLSSANSYADGVGTAANGYTDTQIGIVTSGYQAGDATTLVDANVYTDTAISNLRNELDLINMRTVSTDSTASTGDVVLVDTTAGDVNLEMQVGEDARIIIKKKTTDGNRVNISTSNGTIDGQNLIIIDTPYQSFTFVSDGSNFYII